MREGKNMGLLTAFKKPTLERRRGLGGWGWRIAVELGNEGLKTLAGDGGLCYTLHGKTSHGWGWSRGLVTQAGKPASQAFFLLAHYYLIVDNKQQAFFA